MKIKNRFFSILYDLPIAGYFIKLIIISVLNNIKKGYPELYVGIAFNKIKIANYLFHHKRVASLSAPPSLATPEATPFGLVCVSPTT